MYVPHLRVTASGVLGGDPTTGAGAPEAFSYGFSIGNPNGQFIVPSSPVNATTMADVVADVVAFHGRPSTKVASNARLTVVKIAAIGADGKYLFDPYIGEVDQVGGIGSAQTYPQLSLCVSLNSAKRGPSGRGRFFLPLPIVTVSPSSFLAGETDMNGVRDSTVTLIQAINNQPGLDVDGSTVCVASTKQVNSPVTSVRVGRVIDTIRTRRRSVGEAYTLDGAV